MKFESCKAQVDRLGKGRFFLKVSWILLWLLTGIVIALMALGMSMTDSRSLTNSLAFGKVRDIRDVANATISVGEQNTEKYNYVGSRQLGISLMGDSARWRYLYIDISDLDVESMQCRLTYRDSENIETVYSMQTTLEEGMNRITFSGYKFGFILLEIEEPESCSFMINNVQVREQDKIPVGTEDLLCAGGVFLLYIGVSILLYQILKKKKVNFYIIIEVLQNIYIAFGNAFLWVPGRFSPRIRGWLRTLLLMFWMAYMMMMANYGKYLGERYYRYNFVICLGIVILIAVLMIEKELKPVLWRGQLVFCWLSTSVIMCASEIIYEKRFMGTGYAFLFIFGFLYLAWNNMEDQKAFLKDIMRALRGLLYVSVVFCLLFRPYHEVGGYAGTTWNPNVFSMFLVPVLVSELTELANAIEKKEKRKIILLTLEIGVCSGCNLLADSRIGLLTMAVSFGVFLLYLNRLCLIRLGWKRILLVALAFVISILPMQMILQWGFTNVPERVGHQIEFPSDDFKFTEEGKLIVHAAEVKKGSIAERVIYATEVSKILSKRNLYWMGYVRKMNFLGHAYMPEIWGSRRTAHNGILATSYAYGVLIAVPYLFLYLNGIWLSFRRMYTERCNKNYHFFVFGMMIVIFGFMMVENVERPFLATEWILLYLLLGYLFREQTAR